MSKIIKHLSKNEWWKILAITIVVSAQVYLDLKVPDYMSNITNLVQTSSPEMDLILQQGLYMLICAVGSVCVAIVARYLVSLLGAGFAYRLREEIFDHVQEFSMDEIDKFSTASLITRSTNDVSQVQQFLSGGLQSIITTPITFFWAIYKISNKQWQFSAFTFASVLLVVFTLVIVVVYAHPRQRKIQGYTDDLNKVMRESLTGVRVIRAYNAEEYQAEKFDEANTRLTNNSLQARLVMGLMNPVMKFVNNFLNIGIYVIGAYLIVAAGKTEQLVIFSDMVVFCTYAGKIVRSFMALNRIFMMWPRATVSMERIDEVLSTPPSIVDGTETEGLEKGTVEFKNVTFKYGDGEENVISDISFTVEAGQTVAFIGATGSGKSTIVKLISRFHDATSGEVLVDGRNVKDYTLETVHNIVGYTPQTAVLFTGTVESNVRYGKSSNEANDINEALQVAQASEFVEQMSEVMNSPISRGGTNVSGGQKQRLSIARTIQRNPEIYIFDDTFSALDYKTDRILRSELKKYTNNATTIIVAQRIGTIRDADKIIVIDEGRIVGEGTHSELMSNCKVYQEIAYTQLSGEELA